MGMFTPERETLRRDLLIDAAGESIEVRLSRLTQGDETWLRFDFGCEAIEVRATHLGTTLRRVLDLVELEERKIWAAEAKP